MKVKIVDKKEDVKEMTIEELAEKKFVGVVWGGNKVKFSLENVGAGWAFTSRRYCCGFLGGSPCGKRNKIQEIVNYRCCVTFYTFDNEKEPAKALYLWMAE